MLCLQENDQLAPRGCRVASGELRVVIVEVHNTHLERHLYTLRPEADGASFRSSMAKAFYVSPFLDPVGGYDVRVFGEWAWSYLTFQRRVRLITGRTG